MGDAFAKLIIGLLLVALAIWLLGVVLVAAVYGVGVSLTGAAALGLHRAVANSRVTAAGTVALEVTDGPLGFDLTACPDRVAKAARELQSFAVMLACAATAAAVLVGGYVLISEAASSPNDVDRIKAWITAIVGGGVALFATHWLANRWEYDADILRAADAARSRLTAPMKTATEELRRIESQTAEAARSVGLTPPPSRHDDLVRKLKSESESIIEDPERAEAIARPLLSEADHDRAELSIIGGLMQRIHNEQLGLVDLALEVGRTSLLSKLDEVAAFMACDALQERLSIRDYHWIKANLAGVQGALDQVARGFDGAQSAGPGQDVWDENLPLDEALALRRLNANPHDDPKVVKLLYQALAKAYHSDQGVVKNPRRFQQINDAYGLLKEAWRQRGIRV